MQSLFLFQSEGFELVKRVGENPRLLEDLTGLTDLLNSSDIMDSVIGWCHQKNREKMANHKLKENKKVLDLNSPDMDSVIGLWHQKNGKKMAN